MSLVEKLNQLNQNVFGKDAGEICIDSVELNHLEDDHIVDQEQDLDG